MDMGSRLSRIEWAWSWPLVDFAGNTFKDNFQLKITMFLATKTSNEGLSRRAKTGMVE